MLGERRVARIAESLANSIGLDLMTLAYRRNGILNAENDEVSGENFFLKSFIKAEFSRRGITSPVFVDVGANIGKYTARLTEMFPEAGIYSLEPNPNAFNLMSAALEKLSVPNVRIFNLGLSATPGKKVMHSYSSNNSSSHTSLLPEVISELRRQSDSVSIDASFTSFDRFCADQQLKHVHFLKIDTEGYELDVLGGAREMLERRAIDYIQFEFGECHVYSRVFFRDFYHVLKDYNFYRLMPSGMHLLGGYNVNLEVFHFQNIAAIRKDIQSS